MVDFLLLVIVILVRTLSSLCKFGLKLFFGDFFIFYFFLFYSLYLFKKKRSLWESKNEAWFEVKPCKDHFPMRFFLVVWHVSIFQVMNSSDLSAKVSTWAAAPIKFGGIFTCDIIIESHLI